jgi:NAD kinase
MLRWNLKKDDTIEIKKVTAKFQLFFSLKLNDYIHKLHKTFISNV